MPETKKFRASKKIVLIILSVIIVLVLFIAGLFVFYNTRPLPKGWVAGGKPNCEGDGCIQMPNSNTSRNDTDITTAKKEISTYPYLPIIFPDSFKPLIGITGYAYLITLSPTEYLIGIDRDSNCANAAACSYANIDVKIDFLHSSFKQDIKDAQKLTLKNGTVGYYIPLSCGVSCGDASIILKRGIFEYWISVQSGTKEETEGLANFLIK